MKYRRINLFGGPGLAKSTTAARLFYELKNYNKANGGKPTVELVQEEIKNWAYEGKHPVEYDQLHLFSQQLRREEILLRNGVDLIVTDSPILLNNIYARKHRFPAYEECYSILRGFETKYPSFNYFLKRNTSYVQSGRYQNEGEAIEMDNWIYGALLNEVESRGIHTFTKITPEKLTLDRILKDLDIHV